MASGKLSPRQKMINMMYLVLMALLALNVSKDILKAFHMFEISFIKANKNADEKNSSVMKMFQENMDDANKRGKTEKWFNLAKEAQRLSKELCDYIEADKNTIVKNADGRIEAKDGEKGLTELAQPQNLELHANYYAEGPGKQGKGKVLQTKINDTKSKMLALLKEVKGGDQLIKTLETTTQLKADNPKAAGSDHLSWADDNLVHSPLAGVTTFLTKVQNDCKSLEADVLSALAQNIDAATVKFDKQMAVIIAESTNVMSGSSFKAKVALAAYNSTAAQKILVNGSPVPVKDGLGEINFPASGVGSKTVSAKIETVDPATGATIFVEAAPIEYTTFMPSATISADAMNVLYIGLENPMSISVPGVAPSQVYPNATGISLKPAGAAGKYIATVAAGNKEGTISVSAKMPDGTSKQMGTMKYRIKAVPKPEAQLGTLQSGNYTKGEIGSQSILYAYLNNFVFEGVKYTVTRYRVIFMPKKGYMEESSVSGNGTAAIKGYASKAKAGDLLVLDGIRATGPGGERPLNPITYTFK